MRPTCDILIKIHGVFEHISEPIDRVCVPTRDIFIERPGVVKHTLAIIDFGDVPSADARAGERTRASEHVPHFHIDVDTCVYGPSAQVGVELVCSVRNITETLISGVFRIREDTLETDDVRHVPRAYRGNGISNATYSHCSTRSAGRIVG